MTSLLLKHKSSLPKFHEWFTEYDGGAAKTDVMLWAKKSRNRIVHDSDLDLNSSCHVTWIRDWYTQLEAKATFPPRMSVSEIIKAIRNSQGLPPFGTITIKRRWVDKALNSWEVLDAAAASYMHLSDLLRVGHSAAGVGLCTLEESYTDCVDTTLPEISGNLSCMHFAQAELASHFSVPDGAILDSTQEEYEIDCEQAKASHERYEPPEFPDGDAIERVPGLMAIACKVMEKDGVHGTFAFCFKGESLLTIQAMQFDSQRTKILSFENLGNLVESARADSVIVIGEMWMGLPTEIEKKLGKFFIPARDRLDRVEGLSVYALARDGRHAELMCFVERGSNGETRCSEPIEVDFTGAMNTMIPVQRKWKDMESRGL
ncbi:hypothetical protein [Streptomyces sp. NPDC005407]|uniref:hypothetical protein n=1 Tax=Streptomyces sp. NPDC005407 TaxID=3155340 RepID=UPI00339F63D4